MNIEQLGLYAITLARKIPGSCRLNHIKLEWKGRHKAFPKPWKNKAKQSKPSIALSMKGILSRTLIKCGRSPLALTAPWCSVGFVKGRHVDDLVSPGFEGQMVKVWS